MKLYAPRHPNGCHIALTNGHTLVIPHGEAGITLPKMFQREAIARGCILVGSVAEESEPTGGWRVPLAGPQDAPGELARRRTAQNTCQDRPPALGPILTLGSERMVRAAESTTDSPQVAL